MTVSPGLLETLRAMPSRAKRDAIKTLMTTGDEDARRIATLAANEAPMLDDSPANKRQAPILTK